MKIINRYVLKEHVGPLIFSVTALTSLMLLQYIARKFGDLVGKGLGWDVIGEFFVLSVPFTVAMTLPMAVLVSVLYAFSRLAAENEINALKANGISTRRLMNPVLVWAGVLSLVMLSFNDQVLPRANHRLAVLQNDILRAKPTIALRDQVINTVQESRLYLRANRIEQGTSRLRNVTIYDISDPTRHRTIEADSGYLMLAPNMRDLTLTLYDGVMISAPNDGRSQLARVYFGENHLRVKDVIQQFEQTTATGTAASKGDREMRVCEMQRALVQANVRAQVATQDLREAEWIAGGRKGAQPVARKRVPVRGIGHYYCLMLEQVQGVLRRVGVQEAIAAELPVRGQGQQQPPVQQPPVQQPPVQQLPVPDQGLVPQPVIDSTVPVQAPPVVDTSTLVDESAVQVLGPRAAEADSLQLMHAQVQDEIMRRQRNRYEIEIQKKFALAAACIVLALVAAPISLRFPRGGVGLVLGVSFGIFALYYVCLIGGESLANKDLIPPALAMWGANAIFLAIGLLLYARMGRESATARGGDAGELLEVGRAWFARQARHVGLPLERRRRK